MQEALPHGRCAPAVSSVASEVCIVGWVTAHVALLQDHSKLYLYLSGFEEDPKRRQAMHARRVDMLRPLLQALSRSAFEGEHKRLSFEVGEAYMALFELRAARLRERGKGRGSAAEVAKCNECSRGAVAGFAHFALLYARTWALEGSVFDKDDDALLALLAVEPDDGAPPRASSRLASLTVRSEHLRGGDPPLPERAPVLLPHARQGSALILRAQRPGETRHRVAEALRVAGQTRPQAVREQGRRPAEPLRGRAGHMRGDGGAPARQNRPNTLPRRGPAGDVAGSLGLSLVMFSFIILPYFPHFGRTIARHVFRTRTSVLLASNASANTS